MALNKYMHPRNVYKTKKPDFKQLAIKYDYFREKVTQNLNGKVILDFKEPAALRALTLALLEEDFGLHVTLPVDRLIPTVPQRLNYILWLEDIIGSKSQARGIDIGTGASCIYPLLGCKTNGWEFLASEVDDQNLLFATKNVENNDLKDKIKIKKVDEDKLLLGVVEESQTYDFCMCNPPFFSDHLEAQGISSTRSNDRPDPKSMSTASEKESIAWGGEVRFVCQMIEESLVLRDKIRVYTSMLGKKMSLSLIKDQLARKKITRFSSTEFCQGRTMRWGIAWTFDETLIFPKSTFKELKKPNVPITFEVPRGGMFVKDYTVQAFTEFVRSEIENLKINYHVKHSGKFYSYFILQAKENTWSHQRRKRRKEKFAALNKSPETECRVGADSFLDKSLGESNYDKVGTSQLAELNDALLEKSKSEKHDENVENPIEVKQSLALPEEDDVKLDKNKDGIAAEINLENVATQKNDMSSKEISNLDCIANANEIETVQDLLDKNELTKQSENSGADRGTDSSDEISLKRKLGESTNEHIVKKLKSNEETVSEVKFNKEKNSAVKDEICSFASSKSDYVNDVKTDIDDKSNADEKGKPINNNKQSTSDNSTETSTEIQMEAKICLKDEPVIISTAKLIDVIKSKDTNELEGAKDLKSNKIDDNRMKSRFEIAQQFYAEKEANSQKSSKKRVPHSVYEKMETFNEEEECLALLKLMIRKDEGTVNFSFTYIAGAKEATHQIMQYFRNKLT